MNRTAFKDALEEARAFFNKPELSKHQVQKKTKVRGIVRIRWFMMAYMRARDPNHYSYPIIARSFNLSDHTTAMHGVKKAHEEWGRSIFQKLALQTHTSEQPEEAQFVHRPSADEIEGIGTANLAIWVNGKGWQRGAA